MAVKLIPPRYLESRAFGDDLRALLELDAGILSEIAKMGDSPDGFLRAKNAPALAQKTSTDTDEAMDLLRMASFLYERVTENRLDLEDSARELEEAAKELGLTVDDNKRRALRDLLAYKKQFETGRYASAFPADQSNHFVGVDGLWSIAAVPTREGGLVQVPVLTLSVVWHDIAGNHSSAYFLLTDNDWEALKSSLKRFDEIRGALQASLEKAP